MRKLELMNNQALRLKKGTIFYLFWVDGRVFWRRTIRRKRGSKAKWNLIDMEEVPKDVQAEILMWKMSKRM